MSNSPLATQSPGCDCSRVHITDCRSSPPHGLGRVHWSLLFIEYARLRNSPVTPKLNDGSFDFRTAHEGSELAACASLARSLWSTLFS